MNISRAIVRRGAASIGALSLVSAGLLATGPAQASPILSSSSLAITAFEPDEMEDSQEILMFETIVSEPSSATVGDRGVRFQAPEGCEFDAPTATINCGSEVYDFDYTVIDNDGNEFPAVIESDADDVIVSAQDSANVDRDLTFNLVASEPIAEGVTPEEINASFAEMTAENERFIFESELDAEEAMLSDDEVDYSPWESGPPASGGLIPIPNAAAKRPYKVTVPSNYVYCRVWISAACRPKVLHDYCSWSPDRPVVHFSGYAAIADFRGPCARHDMAIGKIVKKGGSLATKKSKRRSADKTFKSQMFQNCAHEFWRNSRISKGYKASCRSVATTYYKVVSKKTASWNGK